MKPAGWVAAALLTIAALAATLQPGLAAGLNVGSRRAAAGQATISRCDSDGVLTVPNVTGSNVVTVSVSGISAACAGGAATLRLSNGATSSTATGTVPGGGGTMAMTLATPVALTAVVTIDFEIRGP